MKALYIYWKNCLRRSEIDFVPTPPPWGPSVSFLLPLLLPTAPGGHAPALDNLTDSLGFFREQTGCSRGPDNGTDLNIPEVSPPETKHGLDLGALNPEHEAQLSLVISINKRYLKRQALCLLSTIPWRNAEARCSLKGGCLPQRLVTSRSNQSGPTWTPALTFPPPNGVHLGPL